MRRHEQYEELCTLAIIGEVSTSEMHDLREHLSQCADCREQYREFTQFILPQLSISSDYDVSFKADHSPSEKDRLRRQFLAAAQAKGKKFSAEAIRGPEQPLTVSAIADVSARNGFWSNRYRWAVAASVGAVVVVGGYGTHFALTHLEHAHVPHRASTAVTQMANGTANSSTDDPSVARLQTINEEDTRKIGDLEARLSATIAELKIAQQSLHSSQTGQTTLEMQLNQKNSQLAALQAQALSSQQSAAELRTQIAQFQQRLNDSQAAIAADELRSRDLSEQLSTQTASLNQEREMLSVGRDVRDLMGARNLHIIDVHDANGAGKDQKSFGRIFYTEGKQLIFYAFDLDDRRVVNTNYSYEAWGERLGQPSSVKSLGILYVDDKTQRRWSLKVNDPRQLEEINSVFVTLEPHGREDTKPQGKRILFAFLGQEANHP